MNDDYESDGLGSFSLDQIGMRGGAFGGARLLKLTTADVFSTREGEVVGPDRELAVLGLKKVVNKFVGKQLAEPPIVVPDGERVPDIEAMNRAAPQAEWGVGLNGQPQGPYTLILVLMLLDVKTMDRFAFVTPSKGGALAVGDLSDKVKFMRRFRGPDVTPVVTLHTMPFRIARLNITRKRPDFRVVRWIKLGDAGGDSLPTPEAPKPLAGPELAPAEKPAVALVKPAAQGSSAGPGPETFASATLRPPPVVLGSAVQEPTLAEEMGGEAVPL
jgi:hypothetical protein